MHWSLQDALEKLQAAFDGVLANYPDAVLCWVLKRVIFPLGMHFAPPPDALGHEITRVLIQSSAQRDRLTDGMYEPESETDPIYTLEAALEATMKSEAIEVKLRAARKAGTIRGGTPGALIEAARAAGIISTDDMAQLARATQLRNEVVRVDHFPQDMGATEAAEARMTI